MINCEQTWKESTDSPTLYLSGKIKGSVGVYRSEDVVQGWQRINDDAHQFGGPPLIVGGPRAYRRVYVGTHGRGIFYGGPRRGILGEVLGSGVGAHGLYGTQRQRRSGGGSGVAHRNLTGVGASELTGSQDNSA